MLKHLLINDIFKFVCILENTGDFVFSRVGLTVKTYGILHLISTGLNTSKDLLNGSYGSKPNMTKKLKFLEENEFILREIDKSDKRIFRFFVSQKGWNALKEVGPIYEEAVSRIFSGIEERKITDTYEVIGQALKNIETGPCCKIQYEGEDIPTQEK